MNSAILPGPWLNAGAITLGLAWVALLHPVSPDRANSGRRFLGALAVLIGLRTVWNGVGGSPGHVLLQLLAAMAALMVGNLVGSLLGFQKGFTRLHKFQPSTGNSQPGPFRIGGVVMANPLGIIAPFHEGLTGDPWLMVVKSLMDALNAFAWTSPREGLGVALLGITILNLVLGLAGQWLGPRIGTLPTEGIAVTHGLIFAASSLMVLRLRPVPLGNYLAAIPIAGWIAWVWARR